MRIGRTARTAGTIALAAAIVATGSVDAAVAADHRAKEHRAAAARAERRAELRFLADLRTKATALQRDVGPVRQLVSAAQSPTPEALIGARDGLAHGGGAAAVDADVKALSALSAPVVFKPDLAHIVSAAGDIGAAVRVLSSHGSVTKMQSIESLLTDDTEVKLTLADSALDDALTTAFDRQHQKAPDAEAAAPRARANWIYDADQACVLADLDLIPAYETKFTSPAALQRYVRVWHDAMARLSTRLVALARPVVGSAPVGVTTRLSVLAGNVKIFADQMKALKRLDAAGFGVASARLDTILPALARLGDAMRTYGAVGCGNLMHAWAGVPSKKTSRPVTGTI